MKRKNRLEKNMSTVWLRKEDPKFKANVGYRVCSRPGWVSYESLSEKEGWEYSLAFIKS